MQQIVAGSAQPPVSRCALVQIPTSTDFASGEDYGINRMGLAPGSQLTNCGLYYPTTLALCGNKHCCRRKIFPNFSAPAILRVQYARDLSNGDVLIIAVFFGEQFFG